MSLKKYHEKRDLSKSHEPKGGKKSQKLLQFVVQKHAARHLHYDFRIEYRGVLVSFAIPKGPSMNPNDKRLAIHVEDHPIDYQYFEGVIPKENYGAGTVEIWDHGFYGTPHSVEPKEVEKEVKAGFEKGVIDLVLHGKKLKGGFVLIQLKKNEEDKEWLFIKKEDEYAKKSVS